MSYLAAHEGVLNVWVQTIGQDDARVVTRSTARPIRVYFWAWNDEQIIYSQDRDGDENFHLYAVNVATGAEVDLTPHQQVQARLVMRDRNFPDEILVALNNRDPSLHDVWRINTHTGQGKLVFENQAGYVEFLADSQFQTRVACKIDNRTGGMECYTRDSDEEPWYELARWSLEDADTSGPIGLSRDGQTIYMMDSRGRNTGGLYAYWLGDQNGPTYRPIAASDSADLDDVVSDPVSGRPQAAVFYYARKEWQIIDRTIDADVKQLKKAANGDFSIVSRDRDDLHWIVNYIRDDGPASWYLYDRGTRQATFLFTNRAQLEGLTLSRMQPVIIKSRDGLNLVSYLTLPRDKSNKRVPMILLVHGGPWARDRWGFSSLHQWLANRGYAVLSVNFRGSTGFGKAFLNAGNREWAGKMHNDLIDAVNWTVQQKIADPDRVAIMGASYGGYAALVGLTFTPDFFSAGIDIVGPSHVRTLLETIPPYWKPVLSKFETRVGALSEQEYLDQISPLNRAGEIKKPLLIGQGKNDPRVKETESRQIVEAMQRKAMPVTYVVFPDEGHGFARPESNLAFFAIVEAFLAKHLGGNCEPIGSAVAESSAVIEAGRELVPGLN